MNRFRLVRFVIVFAVTWLVFGGVDAIAERPSILWIYVDDMSDWMGCYGDPIAQTPHIDSLAQEGVLFENAFMPAPVCSTTRSALITGTMQTTYGLHQHRTMIKKPLPNGVVTVPELFREAGYLTFNEAKDDYNFERDRNLMYSSEFTRPTRKQVNAHMIGREVSWLKQLQGKPFFGQIQLKGGKIEGETGSKFPAKSRVPDDQVAVPPQYPDHPVFRNAIARHYEQIAETDAQVGAIIAGLKEFGLWDNTIVFFFTDHGSPLPRAKQFLYEDGTKVPLIVRWPKSMQLPRGKSRSDLVSGIDITASSLGLAGMSVPPFMEGRDLFSEDYEPQEYVISARDRMGNAIDRNRTVRSATFRYIRNYKTDRALYQPQYRDKYATFKTLRQLLAQGKLTPLQASYHDAAQRPEEELYDLVNDPHQTVNLADDPEYASVLKGHRDYLQQWEEATDDQGRYPESEESLRLVYESVTGDCVSPEYDFLKIRKTNDNGSEANDGAGDTTSLQPKAEKPKSKPKIIQYPDALVWTDAKLAAKEFPGFEFIGEYSQGNRFLQATPSGKRFYLSIYQGGLPGTGWDGSRVDHEWVELDAMKSRLQGWEKIDRSKNVVGKQPPDNAVVLFDGSDVSAWKNAKIDNGTLQAGAATKRSFRDFTLYLEFMLPLKPEPEISHPHRGNSGVFAVGAYEVQIADTFGIDPDPLAWQEIDLLKPVDTWCGSIYGIRAAKFNMCLPPLTWQSMEIEFKAARFENSVKVSDAEISVIHNGVKVHDQFHVPQGTGGGPAGPRPEVAEGPIYLQNHGNPNRFRNIWIVTR
ncbi:Arylsulfatase [Rubripirellula amarantea]|uniref:Arylsulfatase n=1 Tax=Rubripirellula amarantea TaxID=2527999 RepID=A0A5C5WW18_9BACT|nr:sulfatase-like hydrolase/transferase [Rubripirellula amarantea]TWT54937.1 Arylsulfatase [Rubripirellula amarantea]